MRFFISFVLPAPSHKRLGTFGVNLMSANTSSRCQCGAAHVLDAFLPREWTRHSLRHVHIGSTKRATDTTHHSCLPRRLFAAAAAAKIIIVEYLSSRRAVRALVPNRGAAAESVGPRRGARG